MPLFGPELNIEIGHFWNLGPYDSAPQWACLAATNSLDFASLTDGLVPEDVNGMADVYRYDLTTKEFELLSRSSSGGVIPYEESGISLVAPKIAGSFFGAISPDGKKLAFFTSSSMFDQTDLNATLSLLVRNLETGDASPASCCCSRLLRTSIGSNLVIRRLPVDSDRLGLNNAPWKLVHLSQFAPVRLFGYALPLAVLEGLGMATHQIRLSKALVEDAELQGAIEHRPPAKQIEYWAALGKMVARQLKPEDIIALMQGFLKVRVEEGGQAAFDMDSALRTLDEDRASGALARSVTTSPLRFGIHSTTGIAGVYDADGRLQQIETLRKAEPGSAV